MRKEIEELLAKARNLDIGRIAEILDTPRATLDVKEACGRVSIRIHLGEYMPTGAERFTFRLLTYVSAVLGTDLLDLHKEVWAEGCDTCASGADVGWEVWARYKNWDHGC